METICWNCQRATGGCSWSQNFKPVDGWKVQKTSIRESGVRNFESVKVLECPKFVEDENRQKILNFCQKMKKSENLVNELLSDGILDLSDLEVSDRTFIERKIYFRRNYGK